MKVCPHCEGTGYHNEKYDVVHSVNGKAITMQQGALLAYLRKKRVARFNELVMVLQAFGHKRDIEGPEGLLKSQICLLRRKLKGGDEMIIPVWGYGFELVKRGQPRTVRGHGSKMVDRLLQKYGFNEIQHS